LLIQRIAPSYLNPSSNTKIKKQYMQSPNTAPSCDVFCKTSFCAKAVNRIKSNLEPEKGLSAKKTYRVLTGEGTLSVNIGENSKLGKEPVFFFSYSGEERNISQYKAESFGIDEDYKAKWLDYVLPMKEEGDVYSVNPPYAGLYDRLTYAIFYKDTKKWDDNNGKGYIIEPRKIINRAIEFDKRERGQSPLNIIRKGKTQGKVVVNDTLSELLRTLPKSDEPVIAVVGDFVKGGKDDVLGYIPRNVQSVIFTKTSTSALDHAAASVAGQVASAAVLSDENKIIALQKMAGKFIDMDVNQKGLRWKQIKSSTLEPQNIARPEIKIPEIVPTDRLLKSEEYKPELVGNKAYRLRCLEEMKNRGGLKDVEIPRSFAIPCGIFDRVLAANPEIAADIDKRVQEINQMTDTTAMNQALYDLRLSNYHRPEIAIKIPEETQQEITDFKEKLGLRNSTMARSSFNGEDAKGYSAAGLYDSRFISDEYIRFKLSNSIKFVWGSKWNYRAYMSRRENNIEHAIIKPTVIIQDFVDADYRFTIYTKDPESNSDNKLLIQMRSKESPDPYIIKYDKDKKEIKIEQIARKARSITLDDKFRIISADPIDDPIINNLEQWKPLLKKVCNAAGEIEKEFGTYQDIEGGIKLGADGKVDDSQIYIWQGRDQIV